ncbi:MAG: SEL1-like repeat protein [Candidatus Methanomethylophilaceae archaeon]|nr:SEL1-like repeat protein [Candidatus Methanomethylophilaceae archaeon]
MFHRALAVNDEAPSRRMDHYWLYSGNEKVTVDIWGVCVSRDIFSVISDYFGCDGNLKINYYRATSFITQFTEHVGPDLTADDFIGIETDKEFFSHRYSVTSAIRDYNKTVIRELEESNAKWLIIDWRTAVYGLKRIVYGDGTGEYMSNKTQKFVRAIDEILTRKGVEHIVEDLGLNYPGKLNRKCLNKLVEFVKKRYGSNIIMVDAEESRFYMDLNGEVKAFKDGDLEDRNAILRRFEKEFAAETKCHRIRQPDFMISDAHHRWDLRPVHYAEEYYWYAFEAMSLIMSGAEDADDRIEDLRCRCNTSIAKILGGVSTSANNQMGICKDLMKAKDYAGALKILKTLSARGEPRSMLQLGRMYAKGIGVTRDMDKAAEYMLAAHRADLGNAADTLFDMTFDSGIGDVAFEALRESADRGRVSSMIRLGRAYKNGKGTEADVEKATGWIVDAATSVSTPSQACDVFDVLWKIDDSSQYQTMVNAVSKYADFNGQAMIRMGLACKYGKGVPVNLDKAEKYFQSAAEIGLSQGANELFDILWDRKNKADYERMVNIVRPFAEDGDGKALWRMGRAYRFGKGVPKDLEKSMEYMRAAMKNGAPGAGSDLFEMLNSKGTEDAVKEIAEITTSAAAKGESWACRRMGTMYWRGIGVETNFETAAEWMRNAVDKGNSFAPADLYDILCDMDTEDSRKEMIELANKYAAKGEAWAMRRLGDAYRRGKGVEKNVDKSAEWLTLASKKNNASAACDLFDLGWGLDNEDYLKKAIGFLTLHAKKENAKCIFRLSKAYREGKGVPKDLNKALELAEKAAKSSKAFEREYLSLKKIVDGASRRPDPSAPSRPPRHPLEG